MKKRVLAVLAATALVGVASAYAANPFADVPTDSWAYQAVTTLAEQGIVVGYPDGYFKGQRNITRYEMAQIIARAMAKEDRVNAEQQAMINKLADEFSTELNNLGVRVTTLENKVGNVKLTGDARVKFQQVEDKATDKKEEAYTARVRLGAKARVGENTTAGVRMVMNMGFGTYDKDNKNVTFDRLWVKHNFGAASLTAGRQGLMFGSGLVFDDAIDGVTVSANVASAAMVAGYGYLLADGKQTLTFAQAGFLPMKDTGVKAYYAKYNNLDTKAKADIYGASVDYKQNGIMVGGEWAKTNLNGVKEKDNDAWTAYLGYGNYDQAKGGTWSVSGRYLNYGENFSGEYTTFEGPAYNDYKGWAVNGSYAIADNLGLELDYYFNGKTADGKGKYGNALTAQLKYQF